ncbi:MAG TPA: dolichyl-phosphate beta-glucosyltransferase [Dehalococcoidia bacterium]|nr:dolichyl-phosphate beta-glucosyltransferase [Dehalococcoidia bacterium]
MQVDLVIPVYNEEHILAKSVATLRAFLAEHLPHSWRIVIADNASTDGTLAVAQRLAQGDEGVTFIHIPQKGRGRALKAAWLQSPADIVSYMDVDLSTDLRHYPELVAAIAEEGYDLATGNRLARKAQTRRSLHREALSRGYNFLIKGLLNVRFADAQCGFKALSRLACQELVPLVEDGEWFFDTELLVLAEKRGYRIKDVPVRWVEDPDSRVNIRRTVAQDLRGLWRLRRQLQEAARNRHPPGSKA